MNSDAPGHQLHRRPNGPFVVPILPLDGLAQRRLVRVAAHAREGEAKAFPIVEAEVVAVVRVPVELEAVLAKRRDEGVAVLRLVVDDDAVEVEQDGSRHIGKV